MSPVLRKSAHDSGIPNFSKGEPYPAHFTIKWGGVKVSVKVRWGLFSPLRGQGEVSAVVTLGQPRLTLQHRLLTSPSFTSMSLTSPLPAPLHWVKNVLYPNFSWNTPPHPQKGTMLKMVQFGSLQDGNRLQGLRTGPRPAVASLEGPAG